MLTPEIYGGKPVDLGPVNIDPSEMLYWLYCPIKLPGMGDPVIPPNLLQYSEIIARVWLNCAERWRDSYIYLTARTHWVTPENPGNRPGWHADGFLSDDLNYVWADENPTLFWEPQKLVAFVADHRLSMFQMEAMAESDTGNHKTYPGKHLLRLNQSVIHRVADVKDGGFRSFVKVSVSRHKYALKGNSINHLLAPEWEYNPRKLERNCPITPDAPPC